MSEKNVLTFENRFGRRPVMGVSFLLITFAGLMYAFAPQRGFRFEISYAFFVLGRFLLSCATRGVALTGFVIGTSNDENEKTLKNFLRDCFRCGNRLVEENTIDSFHCHSIHSWTKATCIHRYCHSIFLRWRRISTINICLFHPNMALVEYCSGHLVNSISFLLLVS